MRMLNLAENRGSRGFTFDDLAEIAVRAGVDADAVGRWLAESRDSGELVLLPPDTLSDGTVLGPQRFCLTKHAPSGGHACGRGCDAESGSEPAQHHSLPAV